MPITVRASDLPPRTLSATVAAMARLGPAAVLVALVLAAAPWVARADEATELQRAKFEEGMSHFQEGRFQQAIDRWEPIVQDRGDAKAYRVLYNLGVAYDELGRTTQAADRLGRFLDEAARRPPADVPPEVRAFQEEAHRRRARLDAAYGRIRLVVEGGERVTFLLDREDRSADQALTLYVVPGAHVLTLRPGHPAEESRTLVLAAGAIVEVAVPALPAPPPTTPPPPILTTRPPFSPIWLGVAAGATVASVALPLTLRSSALSVKSSYDAPDATPDRRVALDHQYGVARARYEASWLLPASLGVSTLALSALYAFSPRRKVPISVDVGTRGGSIAIAF